MKKRIFSKISISILVIVLFFTICAVSSKTFAKPMVNVEMETGIEYESNEAVELYNQEEMKEIERISEQEKDIKSKVLKNMIFITIIF